MTREKLKKQKQRSKDKEQNNDMGTEQAYFLAAGTATLTNFTQYRLCMRLP